MYHRRAMMNEKVRASIPVCMRSFGGWRGTGLQVGLFRGLAFSSVLLPVDRRLLLCTRCMV